MNRSFVLYQHIIEILTKDNTYDNIILGTGTLARDFQNKLRLLNLKAPVLVGAKHDPEHGLWHYKRLSELENIDHCRFILCFDVDEWTLIGPAQSEVFRILGIASLKHPRFLRLTIYPTLDEIAGNSYVDANMHDTYLRNGLPYRRFGKTESPFSIHIWGASSASALWLSTQHCWPEFLYDLLAEAGMDATVYAWAKPIYSTADCLTEFLRDGYFHRPDLVILYSGFSEIDPLRHASKNPLTIQSGAGVHQNIRRIQDSYKEKKNNGINHTVDASEIYSTQQRVFKALSRFFGFSFWPIMAANGKLLPEKQAQQLLGLSPGYLERTRKRKDALISKLGDINVLDYTDSFKEIEDIFSVYAETSHLKDEGNMIIAKRCAKDIINTFGKQ